MLPAHFTATLRATACTSLVLLALAPALAARAQNNLQMRIDGVSASGAEPSVLGTDAFPLRSFSVGVNTRPEPPDGSATPDPTAKTSGLADVDFSMAISSATPQLLQLAAEGKVQPKASLVAVDAATGKVRYRIDLEQVVVRNLGFQTLLAREGSVGTLSYERIRISYGDGKDAIRTGWDRTRNAAWK